jgi:hypothetical protein
MERAHRRVQDRAAMRRKFFVRIDRNPFKVSHPKISYRLATTPSSRLYTLSPGLRAPVRHAQPIRRPRQPPFARRDAEPTKPP